MGGITMTLMLILNIREKDRKHRAVFLFVCSIFIFMILDFITYYFMSEFASGSVVFALITLSDTFFCILTTAWVYALIVLINAEKKCKAGLHHIGCIPCAFTDTFDL